MDQKNVDAWHDNALVDFENAMCKLYLEVGSSNWQNVEF